MTSRCQGLFPPHAFKGKALGTRLGKPYPSQHIPSPYMAVPLPPPQKSQSERDMCSSWSIFWKLHAALLKGQRHVSKTVNVKGKPDAAMRTSDKAKHAIKMFWRASKARVLKYCPTIEQISTNGRQKINKCYCWFKRNWKAASACQALLQVYPSLSIHLDRE